VASIADIVTDYQAAKKAYENAAFRARDFAGEGSAGLSGAATRSANAANQERVAMPSKLRTADPSQ